jgi:hypothetical protein
VRGVTLEQFDAPPDAVILVYDTEDELSSETAFEQFVEVMQARYPESFILFLHGETTLETLTADQLETTLKDLIKHKREVEKNRGSDS